MISSYSCACIDAKFQNPYVYCLKMTIEIFSDMNSK